MHRRNPGRYARHSLEKVPETVLIGVDREHLSFLYDDLCDRATALSSGRSDC